MKIALCQINSTVGAFKENSDKIIEYVRNAKDKGADLAVFPEMCLVGYPPKDLVDAEWFVDKAEAALNELCDAVPEGIGVIIGSVTHGYPREKPRNSAILVRKGMVEFVQDKTLLPNYSVFDEKRNFESADQQDIVWYKGIPIGIQICEDAWANSTYVSKTNSKNHYTVDPSTVLVRKGAKIIINISASPYYLDKRREREELLTDIVDDHDVSVVYVNAVGGQDSIVFDGGSMVMTPNGIMAQALSFAEDMVMYDTEQGTGEHHINSKDELKEAIVLGIRDYVRKCGFTKVVIAASGGIDSSVVLCLAVEALGRHNVSAIGMPSQYSSDGSVNDARELCTNLGVRFHVIPIGPILEEYRNELDTESGDFLFGVVEENLQARIRGNIVLAWSNRYADTLVLACSNRSEVAVGYSTIYGDSCGSLCPIGDVFKTKVYELANTINAERKLAPIPFNIIFKEPSAELAPNQFDKNSLPPYEVLDDILVSYLEEHLSPRDITDRKGYDFELTSKITKMVDRNEFKRQQAPLNIKVSKMSFGIERRLPIARK